MLRYSNVLFALFYCRSTELTLAHTHTRVTMIRKAKGNWSVNDIDKWLVTMICDFHNKKNMFIIYFLPDCLMSFHNHQHLEVVTSLEQ